MAQLHGKIARKIDYQLAVNMLAMGATYDDLAVKFGCKALSIQSILSRKGLLKDLIKLPKVRNVIVTIPAQPLGKESDAVRQGLAHELKAQMEALASVSPTRGELGGRNGRTATVKTLIDAASTVFGWSDSGVPSLLIAAPLPEPGQAIDIASSPIPCGVAHPVTPTLPLPEPSPVVERNDASTATNPTSCAASAPHDTESPSQVPT